VGRKPSTSRNAFGKFDTSKSCSHFDLVPFSALGRPGRAADPRLMSGECVAVVVVWAAAACGVLSDTSMSASTKYKICRSSHGDERAASRFSSW
jgi:hypothetical protein